MVDLYLMKRFKQLIHIILVSCAYVLRIEHWPFFARSEKYGPLAFLHGYFALENINNSDPISNGEYAFLRRCIVSHRGERGSVVLFDVGANRGAYARAALFLASQCGVSIELHAFEPMQQSYAALSGDSELRRPGVYLNQWAASDTEGDVTMYADEPDSEIASFSPRNLSRKGASLGQEFSQSVRACRLDAYLLEHHIRVVDLMKIDVEGHELNVIQGLGEKLHPAEIRCIQFEFSGIACALIDIYRILEKAGYDIYRMTRSGHLVRKPYDPLMEKFFANYVACGRP